MICSACRQARLLVRRSASTSAAASALAKTAAPAPARHYSQLARAVQRPQPVPSSAAARRLFSACAVRASEASASAPSASKAPSAGAASTVPKPDDLDDGESHIWDLLAAAFEPKELIVRDISGGCGTMYGIEISSKKFSGANMLKQQRMVYAALGELVKGWHGVQLNTRVP